MTKKLLLTLSSVIAAVLFWYYFGAVSILKDDTSSFSKLQCVSYAPFAKDESPFLFDNGLVISSNRVREDLKLLSKYTDCIRTYSTVGLEMIPAIARENNLKMLMGAWVSKDKVQTKQELDTLIKLASENQDIVKAVIVGNEVLLRGDTSDVQLLEYLKQVKAALPNIKVTYADVWEFWLKHPAIKESTDFVTIHILPYWEDEPMGIKRAINHLADVRGEVESILKDKNILIGETGWPSEGRMREDAHPSKINQALFVREFVQLAVKNNWDYNIIEAFDQPWKRVSEGAVGGFWGLFDKDRNDKNVFAGDVSNFPNYKYLAFGTLALILLFSFLLKNKEISTKRLIAFSSVNTIFAILFVLQIEQYNLTTRTFFEEIWALLILAVHIAIYYFFLLNIVKNKENDSIPISLFYSSAILMLITNIGLAFDGRYKNFEIYVFMISAISFLWAYRNKISELNFGKFEKVLSLLVIISSAYTIYNETIVNIFSNVWIIITLVFAYILNRGSKNISFCQIRELAIYIGIFFAAFLALKYGFVDNKAIATQCNLYAGTLTCKVKDFIGAFLYFGYLGITAFVVALIALVLNKRTTTIIALAVSSCAIVLSNPFLGSIAFIICIYLLTNKKD
ncbi:putative glycosyl hydrolase [Arcobacter acticola]|uniref:Endo-1,3-beta-glucanase btgC n=1 Tax=Arcobacter acticola TaxID=1849015 RepID=A0A6M8EQL6_9BACT|nr:glycosyl hydrolase [Arcobacter acticola]QKE29421.1 putative glycosyl hydrolase [Arcobacter acticola]